jgi:hypothetical protein
LSSNTRKVIAADWATTAACRGTCRLSPDFFVAVAIADRLSALLAENVAREARRAVLSLSAPMSLPSPHSDLLGYLVQSEASIAHGIREDEASKLIVNGFIEPIIKELPMEYAVEMNGRIELQIVGSLG